MSFESAAESFTKCSQNAAQKKIRPDVFDHPELSTLAIGTHGSANLDPSKGAYTQSQYFERNFPVGHGCKTTMFNGNMGSIH